MKPASIAALAAARATRRPVAFAKRLTDGVEFLLPDPSASEALNAAGAAALTADKTGTQTIDDAPWFIESRNPPPRIIIIGAVHIAQALAPLAVMMGFEVTLVDPRSAFGNPERFPGVTILNDWPDSALETLAPDAKTSIVALSHDPKLDDPALDRALRSDAFYIGALGSWKAQTNRLERLGALGHEPANLARIRGPVGLPIGAVGAPEIALSIIAEIVAVHRRSALGLRAE